MASVIGTISRFERPSLNASKKEIIQVQSETGADAYRRYLQDYANALIEDPEGHSEAWAEAERFLDELQVKFGRSKIVRSAA